VEHITVRATQQIYVIISELERSPFKVNAAWTALKHESKIDMYEVSLGINKYIPVVAVLHPEKVIKDTISGETLRKVFLSFVEIISEIL
jgi:hypothetical protein